MRVVKGKQSNHTSFIVPDEMKGEEHKSLHEYVANWILMKNDYVCCDGVAHAFGISRRQASNIIYNIHSKHSDIYQHSIRRIKEGKGNVVKTWLKIESISEAGKKKVTSGAEGRKPRKRAGVDTESMASLFLMRKPGNALWMHG